MKVLLLTALVAFASATPFGVKVRPVLDGRIVGGSPTTIEAYPYQLSLQYFGSHICGASIISADYAVTAAHCTDGSSAHAYSVRTGSTYHNSGGEVIQVQELYQNPNFNGGTFDYDITVLKLTKSISFDDTKQAVSLPELNQEVVAGSDAVCTGWGALSEGGISPLQLQTVTVQIIANDECNQAYGSITDRMICAGVGGGKDACQGDSGGPLVVDNELVGIVSWGIGCARPRYPGVYSSVPNLRDYITSITGI